MHIASLRLQHYRNYEETRVDFSEGSNLILGDNGQGKSNLLESIYLLSTSKSFRNASDQKLVQWNRDDYLVSATFHAEGDVSYSVALEYRDRKKNLSIDGIREKRISDLIGRVFCIILSFEDISLVTGPPYLRRAFLDLILSPEGPGRLPGEPPLVRFCASFSFLTSVFPRVSSCGCNIRRRA